MANPAHMQIVGAQLEATLAKYMYGISLCSIDPHMHERRFTTGIFSRMRLVELYNMNVWYKLAYVKLRKNNK